MELFVRLKEAGVKENLEEWPDMIHCWHVFLGILPEGKEAVEHIARFIQLELK